MLTLVLRLLLKMVGCRWHDVVLDGRSRRGGQVVFDLLFCVHELGHTVIQHRRWHEELAVVWIDHNTMQHGYVVVVVAGARRVEKMIL